MSHWNYRVIEFVSQTGERWRAIHEVYYQDGKPWLHTVNPATIGWDVEDGDNTPLETLEKMKRALTEPILTESDFSSDNRQQEPVLAKPLSALSLALLEIGRSPSFPDDLADRLLQSGICIETEDENAVALWVVGPMFEADPEIMPGTVHGQFFDVLCRAIHDFEKVFYQTNECRADAAAPENCDEVAEQLNRLTEEHGSFAEGLFGSRFVQKPAAWRVAVGEYEGGFIKYNYNQEGTGEALFADEGTIPISDEDHSRLLRLADLVEAPPEHLLHFVLRDGFETTERVATTVLKAQQEKGKFSHDEAMAALKIALAVRESTFEFDLYFDLPSPDANPEDFAEALGSTCNDATLGIGRIGCIGLKFSRTSSSLIGAIVSAIRDVQEAIPGAALDRVDLAPNILGRGDDSSFS